MSIHIEAVKGDIAETILLPGDPMRAKWIANTFLDEPRCFNTVRAMYGYTGSYGGRSVSVMGTGMGIPSISIYVHELITEYGVKNLIRVGSAGSYQPDIRLRDVVLAMSASSTPALNGSDFKGTIYTPTANFDLLLKAYEVSLKNQLKVKVGNVHTSDFFYENQVDSYKDWASLGVLCVEMETAGLYSVAARHQAKALSLLTISDSLVTGERLTSKEREVSFKDMVSIALQLV